LEQAIGFFSSIASCHRMPGIRNIRCTRAVSTPKWGVRRNVSGLTTDFPAKPGKYREIVCEESRGVFAVAHLATSADLSTLPEYQIVAARLPKFWNGELAGTATRIGLRDRGPRAKHRDVA
jgi:hypothetical protein